MILILLIINMVDAKIIDVETALLYGDLEEYLYEVSFLFEDQWSWNFDNVETIFISNNITTTSHTKLVNIRYKYVSWHVKDGMKKIIFFKSAENITIMQINSLWRKIILDKDMIWNYSKVKESVSRMMFYHQIFSLRLFFWYRKSIRLGSPKSVLWWVRLMSQQSTEL